MTSAKLSRYLTTLALSGLFLFGKVVPARPPSGHWGLCGGPLTPPPLGDPSLRNAPNTALHIEADTARHDVRSGEYTLFGRSVITRADQRLKADRMHYNAQTGRVDAEGDVYYQQSGATVAGERGHFNLNTNSGEFTQLRYRIEEGHMHGDATRAEIENPDRTNYQNARFSTCRPGAEDWWLHSGSLTIDEAEHRGTARNVWLSFHGIPFAYAPYLSFPVGEKRKTGFLMPAIGSSSQGGLQFGVPWYWNIAPNYDATFTPTVFAERGLRFGTEFRYLLPSANGRSQFDFLPNDRAAGKNRWLLDLDHALHAGRHLQAHLDVNRVSDKQYLNDFSTNLQQSSNVALPSRADASLNFRDWSVSVQAQSWQPIAQNLAPRNEPFSTVPSIRIGYSPSLTGLPVRFRLATEAVRFQHSESDVLDTGSRIDVMPRLSVPFRTLGYFIEPAIAYRYTAYRLDRPDPTLPDRPSRGLPIYSVDSGLFLERELKLFGNALTHTLEPRLYYLYVARDNQDDLPVFETAQATFTFSQLFETNRFTGPDRMGDANQLTAALSSRVLSAASGFEYLRFSIGQIFYFDDRTVTLPGMAEESAHSSDYITELRTGVPGLMNAWVDYRWNPGGTDNQRLTSQLQFLGGNGRVLNLAYRLQKNNGQRVLSEAEGSVAFPVGTNWQVVGGWNYSFLNGQTQERFAGLEFNSCCYAVRGLFRQFQANRSRGSRQRQIGSAQLQTGYLLQFELKGLGALGDEVPKFLRKAIPGFRSSS
ncbi:LPS-assembly protein LptD [Nitrococcus mobilis]|uniref:LPS-assembly protein LptD n=1 Tax=Nitrococcus mobilis TaxID=35797 RepID=UPI0018DC3F4B|nr:LPS assembly protein LptD [Nitrococcus mobilis]